ncbi:unnamed protein product [Urochloa humidicola]
MAAGAEDEPFSPSDFLDLPRSPDAWQDDELVLTFITRVLMEEEEEDINGGNSALLEVQQPFADILSGTANTSTISANTDGSVAPFSAAPAFAANASWPYDPAKLSQLLLSPDMGGQHGHGSSSTLLPAGAGEDESLSLPASTLFNHGGNNKVTMDMLNQAFLKGMEEANKFLPTNNTLLTDTDHGGTSLSNLLRDNNNNCRGRKNRHSNWDNLEAETGRSCKLMVPESEEASQMDEEFIQNGYQSLVDKMMNMSISMDTEADRKKIRKGKGGASEAVDLRTLLIHCAQAVASDDRLHATLLLNGIKQRSSPRGDATQRLAHCFAEGLEARLAGTGSQVYSSLMSRRTPAVEFHKAYQLYLTVCCFQMVAFKFSNMTITKAIAGRKKVHIVDYGEHYRFQWPILLGCMATWEGGRPEVKITGINLPQPGFRPAAQIEQTGRRLTNFAHQCGIPFKFHSIVAKWETVCADDLNIEPDEVLIVNGLFHLGNLMDEGGDIDSPSPRDMVLNNIQKMRPDVFILCTENSSYNAPFFLTRFREALFYYSAMFDMMDATTSRDNVERTWVEQDLFGRRALNAIACEGSDRVERPETYRQWQVRNNQAGLRQLPLDLDIVKTVSNQVKYGYHKDFFVDVDQQWLLQGWKGRVLYAMSTWVANNATS